MLSIIVPLYKSEENLPRLFTELSRIASQSPVPIEVVFVDDGSPDQSGVITASTLKQFPFAAQLLRLSRNFGAFAAISAGLQHACGEYFAVLAADLQEPPELVLKFYNEMHSGGADVVFGVRSKRRDPMFSSLASKLFWGLYRRLVNPEIPSGGVDVFGCNRTVRDRICAMKEVETSLVGLLFWIGYRRGFVEYERRARQEGKSAWTLSKKIHYLINSVFNFTDLPIRLLLMAGAGGILAAVVGSTVVIWARIMNRISVPGYSATVLVLLFFGGVTALGLGIVGQYLWLCLQNTRNRPSFIIQSQSEWKPGEGSEEPRITARN
jgi:polyisoprenyl-phosphate glycosyltransferase